jgi:hypothetical protein
MTGALPSAALQVDGDLILDLYDAERAAWRALGVLTLGPRAHLPAQNHLTSAIYAQLAAAYSFLRVPTIWIA